MGKNKSLSVTVISTYTMAFYVFGFCHKMLKVYRWYARLEFTRIDWIKEGKAYEIVCHDHWVHRNGYHGTTDGPQFDQEWFPSGHL